MNNHTSSAMGTKPMENPEENRLYDEVELIS